MKGYATAGCRPCRVINPSKIGSMTQVLQTRQCPECGTAFQAQQAKNGRTKEHCSRKCYLKAWSRKNKEWKAEREADTRNQLPVAPVCKKCGEPKSWVKDVSAVRGYRFRCVPCRQAACHSRYHAMSTEERRAQHLKSYNPEKQRRTVLKRMFGITPEQWDEMHKRQGGVCWMCGHDGKGIHRYDRLLVDHCHSTGEVRGLLCHHCNAGLGHFKDDPLLLQRAIDYLNGGNRSLISAVLLSNDEGSVDGREPNSSPDADSGFFRERA